jgi:hypothetical protein
MLEKLNFQKSLSVLILSFAFLLSLLISPKVEGGFQLKWHAGVIVNFILAVMYLVIMSREVKFCDWSTTGTLLTLSGTFLGVFSIANVILINPLDNYGLSMAFLVELLVILNFRNLFMPFHQRGRQLLVNLLMVVLICMITKFVVLGAVIPLLGLGIDSSMVGYLNLPLMAAIWMLSLSCSFIGLHLMRLTIRNENDFQLEQLKKEIGLNRRHMLVLGLENEALLGKSKLEIEDIVSLRVSEIIHNSRQLVELKDSIKQLPDSENSWAAPLFIEAQGAQ